MEGIINKIIDKVKTGRAVFTPGQIEMPGGIIMRLYPSQVKIDIELYGIYTTINIDTRHDLYKELEELFVQ